MKQFPQKLGSIGIWQEWSGRADTRSSSVTFNTQFAWEWIFIETDSDHEADCNGPIHQHSIPHYKEMIAIELVSRSIFCQSWKKSPVKVELSKWPAGNLTDYRGQFKCQKFISVQNIYFSHKKAATISWQAAVKVSKWQRALFLVI